MCLCDVMDLEVGGDVGGFEEDGDDDGWFGGAVGEPVAAGFEPEAVGFLEGGVGARCGEAGGGVLGDFLLGGFDGGEEVAGGGGAVEGFVVGDQRF